MSVIVIDTETTGFRPGVDELLQVSIIDDTGKTLFDSYIRPERAESWPEAQKVNGIAPETVRNAPTIAQALPRIQEIIDGAQVIVGYNVNFDYSMLACAGLRFDGLHMEPARLELVDVMEQFAFVYREWNEYYGNWKWQSLSTAAAYYGYDWGDTCAHDALADCKATLFVWDKIREGIGNG